MGDMSRESGSSGQRSTDARFFEIGGLTIRLESDLPFTDTSFLPKFQAFITEETDDVSIVLRHHYSLPAMNPGELGQPVYDQVPWRVYRHNGRWIYFGIAPGGDERTPFIQGVFDDEHCSGDIYHPDTTSIERGSWATLTCFPSDQMVLSHALAHHQACYLHSSGLIMRNQGLLFIGRSGAGKSTLLKMVLERGQVLCDDRNVVRLHAGDYWAYGTWSHGEVPIVSNARAPLGLMLFLQQAPENRLQKIDDKREIVRLLLSSLIRPFETKMWWEKSLELIESIAQRVPAAYLFFDTSGKVADLLDGAGNGILPSAGELA